VNGNRSDIRGSLPTDHTWFVCEVEQQDIDRLFIISSDDWSDISGGSFRVADVAARLELTSTNMDTIRIANDIRSKITHVASGGQLDTKLMAITDSPSLFGPFTLIEGNRRSVTFLQRGTLVGSLIFVGYSSAVVHCVCARHTYRRFIQACRAWQGGLA
jgi:hypothetical protein